MSKTLIIIALLFVFFPSFSQDLYEDYLPSKTIVADNFTSNKDRWNTEFVTDSCYSTNITNGVFEITSKCKNTYPIFFLSKTFNLTKNFEIEAEIQFVKGEDNNALSLVWGKEENSYNRYIFGISGNGQYKIAQYNGNWINIVNWTYSDSIKKTDFNKLTVRKINNQYYFFLNEQLIYTLVFTGFTGDQIGFQDNQNTTMRVRHLKVSYLKSKSQKMPVVTKSENRELLREHRWGGSLSPLMGYIHAIGETNNRWKGGWSIVDLLASYRFLPNLGIETGVNVSYVKIAKQNQVNVTVTNGYSSWDEKINNGVDISCPLGLKVIFPVSHSRNNFLILGGGCNYVHKDNSTNISGFKPIHSSGFGYFCRLAYFMRTEKTDNEGVDFQIRLITDTYKGTWVPANVRAKDKMLLFTMDCSIL